MNEYKKEAIKELCKELLSEGFRVFLAERETYGFFTNDSGDRVVCFQFDILTISFGGNYKTSNPRQTGSGWRMDDGLSYKGMINSSAPKWAVRDHEWRHTTLNEHLEVYGNSSNYKEITE